MEDFKIVATIFLYLIANAAGQQIVGDLNDDSVLRWCTVSTNEQLKCQNFSLAVRRDSVHFGRNILQVECIKRFNKEECMTLLDEGTVHATSLDAGEVFIGGRYHSLIPILQEVGEGGVRFYYSVAVVKKNSLPDVHTLKDLRGKKACFPGVGMHGGWIIPIQVMMREGGLEVIDCNNHVKSAINYFGPSCAIDSLADKYNPIGDNSDKLCSLCIGAIPGGRCTSADPYAGFEGALRCLVEAGEIAFLKHTTVQEVTSLGLQLSTIRKENFELLCRDGTRRSVDEYRACNWGSVPTHAVVTSSAQTTERRRSIQSFLKKAVQLYGGSSPLVPYNRTGNQPTDFNQDRPSSNQFGRQDNRGDEFGRQDKFGRPDTRSDMFGRLDQFERQDERQTDKGNFDSNRRENFDSNRRENSNFDSNRRENSNFDSNRRENSNFDSNRRENSNFDSNRQNPFGFLEHSNGQRGRTTRQVDPFRRDQFDRNVQNQPGRSLDELDHSGGRDFNSLHSGDQRPNFDSFKLFESAPRYGIQHNLMFQDITRDLVALEENRQTYSGYLESALDPILKVRDCPVRRMTLCVTSEPELEKCVKMRTALKAQILKPEMSCYKGHSHIHCMQAIRNGDADVTVLDASDVYTAGLNYDLIPFIAEVYNLGQPEYYVVGVTREDDPSTELTYLRGKYTCHTGINTAAGWVLPLAYLISNGWIRSYGCNSVRAAAEYFSKSCVPGALSTEYNTGVPYDNLCHLCHGSSYRYCRRDASEDYYGHTGAFRCLVEGGGDVAFVKHTTVMENTDGKRREWWARNTLTDDFELLCPDGTRAALQDYQRCNLGKAKANAIVTRGGAGYNETQLQAFINLFVYSQQFYGRKDPDEYSFSMYYSPPPYWDLIFQDAAQKLLVLPPEERHFRTYLGRDFLRARALVDCHATAPRFVVSTLMLTLLVATLHVL